MEIILVSPAAVQSSNGNYTTAIRWKKILQTLGHHVYLTQTYDKRRCDMMIALHAWRSAKAIQSFKSHFPDKPLIVALTGTDAYRFIHTHAEETLKSIELSDYLVGLHELIANAIPQQFHHKLNVIFQASTLKPSRNKKIKNHFNICIAGHLRDEKDPLRTAYAVRSLPTSSKIYAAHYGKAHDREWERQARLENAKNRRYCWQGEISQSLLRVKFSQAKLMVLSSRMEGGANIISEAIMLGLPVIASDIEGSIGLLGKNYAGYFEVENTLHLKNILLHCERNKDFLHLLKYQCQTRRKLFTQQKELSNWQQLLYKVINS